MAKKIKDPALFTGAYKVNLAAFNKLGLFDPVLTADTPLFIDPMLLASSSVPEMVEAEKTYKKFFADLMTLLIASKKEDDVAWRAAKNMLSFHELPGTCLGYSAGTIGGSGWSDVLTSQLFRTAKEIVDMGVTNPDLFLMLGLFEPGIGPDRISDMVTNVIRKDLIALSERVAKTLEIPTEKFIINNESGNLILNLGQIKKTPIIFVPKDVLRALPIALDYEDIVENAQQNEALRNSLNKDIGEVWKKAYTAAEKENLRKDLFGSKDAINAWLKALRAARPKPYDLTEDAEGLIRWAKVAATIAAEHPKAIAKPAKLDLQSMHAIVAEIIEQFRYLIEDRDLWKEMWLGKKSRSEKTAQRLFFAVADSYCKSNNLDISPEAETGNGPVDFKFSKGSKARVLVEIKLSKGTVEHGYRVQLQKYMAAEKADGVYVVLDVGSIGKKMTQVRAARAEFVAQKKPAPEIHLIDCLPRLSASKAKK